MVGTLPQRPRLSAALVVVAVVVGGVVIARVPRAGLAVVAFGLFVALTRLRPSTLLIALVGVTAIVPFGVQNRFGIGGGTGSAGLLPSDALLLAGLLRVAPILLRKRFGNRLLFGTAVISVFVAIAGLQFVRGLSLGRNPSTVGAEFRILLGFATFLLAVPVVSDDRERGRLLRALPALGLILAVWGLLQWGLTLTFSDAGDAGLREGVRLTTGGRGQIQGGLFAFPLAVILGLAAFTSGHVQRARTRILLLAVVVLNGLCVLLTYERTFWVTTVVCCGWVIVKARGVQRARVVFGALAGVILVMVALSTFVPNELATARERLLSLGQYGTDNSVRYRLTESRYVWTEIAEHPLVGSGLGASIFWGRPWELVPPSSFTFAHNGYLWVAWKLGIPAALLLGILLAFAISVRGPPNEERLFGSVRGGCKAGMLSIVIASVTFPAFNQLSITPTLALLLALCLAPRVSVRTQRSSQERGGAGRSPSRMVASR